MALAGAVTYLPLVRLAGVVLVVAPSRRGEIMIERTCSDAIASRVITRPLLAACLLFAATETPATPRFNAIPPEPQTPVTKEDPHLR